MRLIMIVAVMGVFVSARPCAARGPLPLSAPVPSDSQLSSRWAISGGMGVEYLSLPDVVDFVNGVSAQFGAVTRVPDFRAGVEFFGTLAYPLSEDWVLKGEYVFLLASYNPNIPYGPSDFTLAIHIPTLILQYVLWDERLYDVKVGCGLGYHAASLSTKYSLVDDRLTGNGPGVVFDAEGNNALGDHLFVYVGGEARFEFIGRLKSSGSAARPGLLALPTGNGFGIGARLGLSYYF